MSEERQHTSEQHIISRRTYISVFFGLVGLLVLTYIAAQIELGLATIPVAMIIATAKALLIMLYFMHLRYTNSLIVLVGVGGFVWLAILLFPTVFDYLSRGWFG